MKLNNNGWGIKTMLLLTSVLVFFFCLSIYFIYILYNSLDLSLGLNDEYINNESYAYYEENMIEAAEEYIGDIELALDNNVIISLETLIELDYIDEIYDIDTNNKCDGYVDVKNKKLKSYISCDNYETKGYRK